MKVAKSHKQGKKNKRLKKPPEEELNIRYHEFNPEWNYTISPRKQHDKK